MFYNKHSAGCIANSVQATVVNVLLDLWYYLLQHTCDTYKFDEIPLSLTLSKRAQTI